MELVGVVEKVINNDVILAIKRVSGCGGNCEGCSGCETAFHELKVKNTLGAKVGDNVTVEFFERESMKATIIIYVIPLLAFLIGLFLGKAFKFSDILSLLLGLVSLFIGFLIVYFIDKKYKKNMPLAKMVKVL